MTPPVVLRPIAQAEFDEAADWYERQGAGKGARFTAAVGTVLMTIAAWPKAHPEVHHDVREALLPRHPYAIYDRVGTDRITVLAVFHTSRDPVEWRKRATERATDVEPPG